MNLVKLLQISTRKYSSSKIITSLDIFDRNVKKIHRNLTAVDPNNADYDYVKEEVGYRVADRIFDIKRTFNQICDLGCQKGYVSKHLTKVSFVIFEIKTNFLSRI